MEEGRSSMKLKEGHDISVENSLFIFLSPPCCHRRAGGARRGIHFTTTGGKWTEGTRKVKSDREKEREQREGL